MSSKSTANSVFFRYSPSDSSITRKNFEAFFSDIGPVKKCSLIRQDKTEATEKRRDAKGYGFCKFTCQEDANEAAEKLNEKTMELEYGMKVKVWVEVADKEAAVTKDKKPTIKLPEGTPGDDSKSVPTDELLLLQSKKRTSRVIIRNLSFYATENNIRQVMQERFGEVIEINLPLVPLQNSQGKKKQQHRGFAFVTFANQNAANKAVEACASDEKVLIKNRPIAIDFSVSKAHHQRLQEEEKNETQTDTQNEAESDDDSEDAKENTDDVDDDDSESEEDTASESDADSESEHDSDEDTEEEKDEIADEAEYKRSLFLRNLPFDATRHDLFQLFKPFGHIEAVFLVKDRETGINKGTAFVKFSKEGGCVRALEACNSNSETVDIFKSGKKLMTEGDSSGGGIYLNGRRILVDLAVDKSTADTLKVERDENGKPIEKIGKDRRNLYLKGEGRVESSHDNDDPNSWENIPESDQLKRGRAHQDKATKLRSPLFFINPLRLSIRNLAKHVDEKGLKELMVKGIKNGLKNKLVSKEDVIAHYRAAGEMTKREIIEKVTKAEADGSLIPQFDEKSIKSFIPSVFIDRDFTNLKDTGTSKGSKIVAPSRGFGFVEFTHHAHALACLRELNNNSAYSAEYVAGGKKATEMKKKSKKRKKLKPIVTDMEDGTSSGDFVGEDGRVRIPRLIIEFTVENKAKARKQAERKAQQAANIEKQKAVSKDSKTENAKEKKKKKSRGALQREKKRKAKEAGIEEHENDEKDVVSDKIQKKEDNSVVDEPKTKVKGLKPPKKIKKSDKEDNVFEEMVQSYKRKFAADVDDVTTEKAVENPRVEVAKKRWFD